MAHGMHARPSSAFHPPDSDGPSEAEAHQAWQMRETCMAEKREAADAAHAALRNAEAALAHMMPALNACKQLPGMREHAWIQDGSTDQPPTTLAQFLDALIPLPLPTTTTTLPEPPKLLPCSTSSAQGPQPAATLLQVLLQHVPQAHEAAVNARNAAQGVLAARDAYERALNDVSPHRMISTSVGKAHQHCLVSTSISGVEHQQAVTIHTCCSACSCEGSTKL